MASAGAYSFPGSTFSATTVYDLLRFMLLVLSVASCGQSRAGSHINLLA
jgi:hypothetical protein